MSVCGFSDTTLITVYNISASVISNTKITLILPAGVTYIAGSNVGTGISESNISNLNKPVFSGPNLFIGQNFNFRVRIQSNCDIIPLLSGNNTPQIDVRVDYTGNYDAGSSIPFVPIIPSPGFASISNTSFIGNVGDKFVRKVTITNYGKGPLTGLRLIRINGKDVSGVSQSGFGTKKNGDTLNTYFTTTDFSKIGDKDTFFEQNESITITDTFTILGCKKTNTYYEIGWGCEGKICQIIKSNASVTISSDNPNLVVWPASKDRYCFNGTNPNAQFLTITNTGKKPAKDMYVNIFVGTGAANTYIDTTSFYVNLNTKGTKKLLVMDTAYKYVYTSGCVPSGALNYVRLKLGDLSPKDTLYITWNMTRCAETQCGYGFYDINWIYNYNYKNQCNDLVQTGNAWGKVYTLSSAGVSTWVPTDLAPDETKDFKFTFNSFYNVPLSSTGEIRIDMVLPISLTHTLSKNDFFIVNGALTNTWYPDSVVMRGDTLRAFMGKAFKFGLPNAELTVRLKGTCTKTSSNLLLPVSMSLYYNTEPSCHPFTWIRPVCVWFNVKVHCSNACNQGLVFKNFEAKRVSFGLPDNNNDGIPDATGSLDSTKVRSERVMYGDTFETVFIGKPKTNSTYRNWRYGYAESYVTYGKYVDVVEAYLVVYKGITLQTGNCNTVRVQKIVSGGNATFKFDFTVDSIYPKGCLSSSYRFTGNDSIRLVVRYKVTGNISGAAATLNFANRFYFGSVANPSKTQSFQCDTFSANLLLYGYYYANCCSDNTVYSDCAERYLSQSWYLGMGPCCQNYAGNNLFPYEYRNFTKLKSIRMFLPAGFKIINTYFGQYRTTGVGTYVLERKDTVPSVKGTTNPVVFDFRKYYTDSGGTIKPGDDGVQGYFSYTVQPRCNLPANTPIRLDYEYIFERSGILGKGYDTISTKTNGSYDVFTFTPPTLSLSPAIPVVYATSDTVEWEVRYTNPSSTFNAYNIWISPKKNTNIRVVEVRDMAVDTVIPASKDIYKAGILAAGKMRRFKVRAVFNSCSPDSLILYGSYNCAEYPVDFASYPCTPNATTLYLEPQNTRLQMTLTDSAKVLDLCAENKITLLMENIQSVAAFNTKVRVSLPIGMSVVSGSATMKYPLSAAAVGIGLPKLVSGTIYEWDLSSLSSKIAKGFKGTSDTAANKLLIVFRVKTDCDYASGSFISARGVANLKCGDPIPSIPGFSNPLDIKGVTRPYYTLVKSWADTLLPCQKPMVLKTRVVYLGPSKSGVKDRIEVFLPQGMYLDTSYWNAVRNAPNKDSLVVSTINGANLLSWLMPANITPGDSMEFDIHVKGESDILNCGPADIIPRSVVVQPVVCITSNTSCDIKVITGSELANPWIDKGSLKIENPSISTNLISADSEMVTLNYTVRNTGRFMSKSNPLIVRYHYDGNANGKWDNTDVLLTSDTFYKDLVNNAAFSISKTFKVAAGMSCGILAVTDSAACACLFGQKLFPIPPLQNAGRDTGICSGQPLSLGTFNVKSFKFQWDNDQILDDISLAQPAFIATNQTGVPESYTVVLSTDRGLCTTKDTIVVDIFPLPNINTITKDTEICEKRIVNLVAKTNGGNGGNQYTWSPATGLTTPGAISTFARPDSTTNYQVKVTDQKGCSAMDTTRIRVNPFPRAWFTWPVTCQGSDPLISDSTTLAKGKIAIRVWKIAGYDTFGVTQLNIPMGKVSKAPVTLIVESTIGCGDTVTRMVDVKALPRVSFNQPYVCDRDSIKFTNTSKIDSGNILDWTWYFGDGKISKVQSPKHGYPSYADYNVQLVASSNYGCVDSASSLARVFPNPAAQFTSAANCERDTVRMANSSALFGDTVLQYSWDLGVSGMSQVPNPVFYADTFGKYLINLKVTTVHGCVDSISKTTVVHAVPKASFTTFDHCLDASSVFTDSSKLAQGNIVSYIWNFGDGITSGLRSPLHLYNKPGTYGVDLTVVSDYGCRDSIMKNTDIWPLARPTFTANSHCLGETLQGNSSTWGGGTVAEYKWYTGDGDSSQNANLVYTYLKEGQYTLQLFTTTDKGCVRDTQASIDVWPLPTVTASAVNPCNDDSAIFTGTASISRGLLASYKWFVSDGSSSVLKVYKHVFAPAGPYAGTFVVNSEHFCIDSATANIVINPAVEVKFAGTDVCIDETTQFTDLSISSEPITAWAWRLGDGQAASNQNPVYVYKKPNTFNVDLTITTKPGCDYSTTASVVVHPRPYPGFITNPSVGTIINPNIDIMDMSNGADNLQYKISDGFSSTLANFTHTFPDSGWFKIKQIAYTQYGCMDSISDSIFIQYMYTLFVPNTFTPNNDTKNEKFGPGGLGIAWYDMKIYSRWGELIYATDNSQPWDGTVNGEVVPDGVYAVLINIRDYKNRRHTYQGSITILK